MARTTKAQKPQKGPSSTLSLKEKETQPPPPQVQGRKVLAPEFQSESLDLGFSSLRIYYVDVGLEPYWTWSIGKHTGGQYESRLDAKWAGVYHGYLMIEAARDILEPTYRKAVTRRGVESGSVQRVHT